MLSSRTFQRLDVLARLARPRAKEQSFGGVQLVLVGDFLQLPPVVTAGVTLPGGKFAFQSRAWRLANVRCVELTRNWRQSGDRQFARLLLELREGRCPDWASALLNQSACRRSTGEESAALQPVRLCTHRADAEAWNARRLAELPGEARELGARDSDERLTKALDAICPASRRLSLKPGAHVMLLRNLDVSAGLVNGTRGIVRRFTQASEGSLPEVEFQVQKGGRREKLCRIVRRERWTLYSNNSSSSASRAQVPLALAWSISIHKSQGLTLDAAELTISKVFEPGQAYVALSRCRSLESMRLLDWRPDSIRADSTVVEFYKTIRRNRPDTIQPPDFDDIDLMLDF